MKIVRWLILLSAAFALIYLAASLVHREPVLFHIMAEKDCACGEYHEDVTGLVIFNPLRNRSPERTADKFLQGLRGGECNVSDSTVCQYALDGHQVSEWRLANAQTEADREILYYRLTKMGTGEEKYRLTGEGVVEVKHTQNRWAVVAYSSYF